MLTYGPDTRRKARAWSRSRLKPLVHVTIPDTCWGPLPLKTRCHGNASACISHITKLQAVRMRPARAAQGCRGARRTAAAPARWSASRHLQGRRERRQVGPDVPWPERQPLCSSK